VVWCGAVWGGVVSFMQFKAHFFYFCNVVPLIEPPFIISCQKQKCEFVRSWDFDFG
jgi:hypothetical protein